MQKVNRNSKEFSRYSFLTIASFCQCRHVCKNSPVEEAVSILDPTTVISDKLRLKGAPMKSGALSFTSVTLT